MILEQKIKKLFHRINPYPNSFEKKHSISNILDNPKKYKNAKQCRMVNAKNG